MCALEAFGPQTAEELAGRLGWSRTRDLRQRYLGPLCELGLVVEREGLYALVGSYEVAQERVKQRPYSTVQLRRKRSRTPEGHSVTEVVESGSVASEEQREIRDAERYGREREGFREDWSAGLIAPGERYASERRRRAVEREMERTGAVVVEFAGEEAGELQKVQVPEQMPDQRGAFELARDLSAIEANVLDETDYALADALAEFLAPGTRAVATNVRAG